MSVNGPESYKLHLSRLKSRLDENAALSQAVGGDFLVIGQLELNLLLQLGLGSASFLVDVGCGSGRLAGHAAQIPGLTYVGTDVVPELLAHARAVANRSDFEFVETNGIVIPCGDAVADFVCFFSVFTHLKHEDTYRYLAEALRVLKPGGRIVFSFLEFRIPSHWEVFQHTLNHGKPDDPLNQFMDRDGIARWAYYLGLTVESIWDGDKPHIPITEEVVWEQGYVSRDFAALGQSVAVLRKS